MHTDELQIWSPATEQSHLSRQPNHENLRDSSGELIILFFLGASRHMLLSSSRKAAHNPRFTHEPQETKETDDGQDGGCVK
jgi:hypothetical protein